MKSLRADLYCRVSTTEQAEEGYSLQEQERRLRSFAEAQGWAVNACYVDGGCSGANLDRPGIQAVIADCRAGSVDRVVTYKLDRLSRSQKDTLFLIEDVFLAHGVGYVSVTESLDTSTPLGMAMIGILSVFAQLEREQIKERMMLGRIAAARDGKWRGGSGVPIGYRYQRKTATEDGHLVVDPYEAAQVREVFHRFLSGHTFHAIYDYMHERYTTSYGQFASGGAARVPAMLENRTYIGEIRYQGKWYPSTHEPIIDRDTFDRAQARLAEYRATLDEHRRKPYQTGHLLTGLLWCGECGARWAFHSCTYKAKDGERRAYDTYMCYTRNAHKSQRRADHCSVRPWKASELEDLVWSQVEALRFEDAVADDAPDPAVEAYQSRLDEVERQRARLVDLYTVGALPIEAVQEKADALLSEKANLEAAIASASAGSGRLSADELRTALDGVARIRGAGLDEQRELLRLLIQRIELFPDREVRIQWNI